MKKNILLITLAIYIATSLISFQVKATIRRVNNNLNYIQSPSGVGVCSKCYQDLISAVGAAVDGDTIHIEGSPNWYQGTTIHRKVVIIGPGYFIGEPNSNSNPNLQYNTDIATVFYLQFDSGSQGSQVYGITSNALNGTALQINTDSIIIERCHLATGLRIISGINHSIIRQNYIDGGINIFAASQNLIIENNYITNIIIPSGSSGMVNQNTLAGDINSYNPLIVTNNFLSTAQQQNNTNANFYNNIFFDNLPTWATGTNSVVALINTFITGSSTDGNYHINVACSTCLTGSTSGGEVGMFGGNTPYILSGIPNIPTIYNLSAQPNAIQGNTTPAQISTRSNNKN